ncbi:GNAT family N-acetyltransferase [Streptococcus suis]|uniref:Putative acetyltransferase n=1 Tax=Streptococcus suis TaxID=1307 RepID=M1VNY5_STRSU|nr:GNAT family N-acetyltransferase [Streptococcus suis]BAM94712.1 putative acetyltransferase [Streptococcus suis]HEM3205530.1 GNAT family N-acetyltransferase [Streptococcus suis 93A]HEM4081614.1 GNAT family N-acetyltransferase [Streptococcus suis]
MKKDYQIILNPNENEINKVVEIHLSTFKGLFLTFLGRGFLKNLYAGFLEHNFSELMLITTNNDVIGFIAYSENISAFYKWLLKNKFFQFLWYSFLASIRSPKASIRLLRALFYPQKSRSNESYVELSSIGIHPNYKNQGFGSALISEFIKRQNFSEIDYIKLTTDSIDNDLANTFYKKNGFKLYSTFTTPEGRKMNEYRYYEEKI